MKFPHHHLALAAFTACVACADREQQNADTVAAVPDKVEVAVFDQLDTDRNGFINAIEATEDSALMEKYIALDANSDRKIDRAEFAELETHETRTDSTVPASVSTGGTEKGQETAQEKDAGSKY